MCGEDVTVGIEDALDDAWLDESSAVGVGAEGASDLEWGEHHFVALGDGLCAGAGPFIEGVDEAGVFPG